MGRAPCGAGVYVLPLAMKKRAIIALIMCLVVVTSFSGCVKIVKIGQEGELTGQVEFSAKDNVASIWDSKAIPELTEKSVDLSQFLQEANGDLTSLAEKYGKYSMGTSGELSYTVKGTGTVTEVNTEKKAGYMVVTLDSYSGPIVLKLQIGSVYKGSAVRDSLSFIKYEDYTNQVDWANISQSIHEVIQTSVIDKTDVAAMTGKTITFTGCFTVNKADEILITPVVLTVQ